MRQREYCDKLAENFKSVFVCNIRMVGVFYLNFFITVLFEWPTFSMTYFHGFFSNVLVGPPHTHNISFINYVCYDKYARASKSMVSKPPVQADGVTDSIKYIFILSESVLYRKLLVLMLKLL